nr:helicase-related protein [Siccirubricoccus sp. G192]
MLRHYLKEAGLNQGRRGWLDAHGCIIFSQYYDTAKWVADCVAAEFPAIPVGLYAGAGRSGIYKDGQFASTDRNVIKTAVRNHELRLLVATDAACEGLNLQTLGTLVNIDLPWNPSKLEQRIGRIKRFGQVRDRVDMLSLVYEGSRDEVVYDRLSERMKDRFDIFGQLPDTLDDDWIENEETLEAELRKHADRKRQASAFDVRWGGHGHGRGRHRGPALLAAGLGNVHAGAGASGRRGGALPRLVDRTVCRTLTTLRELCGAQFRRSMARLVEPSGSLLPTVTAITAGDGGRRRACST